MTRGELVKRLADAATRPIDGNDQRSAVLPATPQAHAAHAAAGAAGDLFVWFEDTSDRKRNGRRGVAGLPESLLPWTNKMRIVDRRYVEGHLHLLSAVRVRCHERQGERIAAIYTAALSVGTVAWIGTGQQYEAAWREMFPYAEPANDAGAVRSDP